MYMFDLNRRYNRPIVTPIVAPIHTKPVYSNISYQQAIAQKYSRRGRDSPSGYGPLEVIVLKKLPEKRLNQYYGSMKSLNYINSEYVARHFLMKRSCC